MKRIIVLLVTFIWSSGSVFAEGKWTSYSYPEEAVAGQIAVDNHNAVWIADWTSRIFYFAQGKWTHIDRSATTPCRRCR